MKFYSGFSLKEESDFFKSYLSDTDYTVAGFSYGSIKAAEYAAMQRRRVDKLQLFSPVFFQNRPEKFRRLQMMAYKKDRQAYLDQFIMNSFAPYTVSTRLQHRATTAAELEELLSYIWEPKLLDYIVDKGTLIEVYLGGEDRIIDVNAAREFFKPFATVYFIKKANHFLGVPL